jgi:uridine phosphorylase
MLTPSVQVLVLDLATIAGVTVGTDGAMAMAIIAGEEVILTSTALQAGETITYTTPPMFTTTTIPQLSLMVLVDSVLP